MRKPRHTAEEIARAYGRHCQFGCRVCGRRCAARHSYNHRFDCCGVVEAHVLIDLRPAVAGMPAYATGPSHTTREDKRP